MANITGASLNGIYNRLNGISNYHPLESDAFSDWSVEAGDEVTVTREGNSYTSPVSNTSLTWKGTTPQVTMNSSGNEERDSVTTTSKKKYYSSSSGIRNNQSLYNDVWSEDGHLHSSLQQTESSIHAYVEDIYKQMKSGLALTSSSALLYVDNKYTQMQSGLKLTESSAHLYTRNAYTQMQSGLQLTESSALLYASNKYTQMQSGLSLTESSAHLYTRNAYTQMQSGLKLSESSAHLYTRNAYTQMQSGLRLTESSALLYTTNRYTQMTSGLKLTESSAHLYTSNKYTQMSSGLKLTDSSLRLYVNNNYKQMQAGLALTTSSAAMYVSSRTSKAQLLLTITNGVSNAKLTADTIDIDGLITSLEAKDVQVNGFNAYNGEFTNDCTVDGKLTIYGDTAGNAADFVSLSIDGVTLNILNAQVSGNNLIITYVDGSTQTFSKATTLEGEWGSGQFLVTASPQNKKIRTNLTCAPAQAYISSNVIYIPVKATIGTSATIHDCEYSAYTNVSNVFSSMSITRSLAGKDTDNADIYYGTLYYYNAKTGQYVSAASGSKYWYYSSTNKSGTSTVYY